MGWDGTKRRVWLLGALLGATDRVTAAMTAGKPKASPSAGSLVGLVVLAGGSHEDDEHEGVEQVAPACTAEAGGTAGAEVR